LLHRYQLAPAEHLLYQMEFSLNQARTFFSGFLFLLFTEFFCVNFHTLSQKVLLKTHMTRVEV